MNKLYGNYLGICVATEPPDAPNFRGRVKIWIPGILPSGGVALNTAKNVGQRIVTTVGSNLLNSLQPDEVKRLERVLPWAECAAPVVGSSTPVHYNPSIGQSRQDTYNEIDENVDLSSFRSASGENTVTTKKTVYSLGNNAISASGRRGTDEITDDYTIQGKTATGQNLTPGVVAVSNRTPIVPLGTIFKGEDGKVYIAADVYLRADRVIDYYLPPDQYNVNLSKNQHTIQVLGKIDRKDIPKTPQGIRKLLSSYGEVPPGESAVEWLTGESAANSVTGIDSSAVVPQPSPQLTPQGKPADQQTVAAQQSDSGGDSEDFTQEWYAIARSDRTSDASVPPGRNFRSLGNGTNGSLGRCARGVYDILKKSGFRPPGSANGRDFGTVARAMGWQKLDVNDPRKAPPGSMLVYTGGAAGHVELVATNPSNGQRRYVSDYVSANPSSRTLAEVWFPPKDAIVAAQQRAPNPVAVATADDDFSGPEDTESNNSNLVNNISPMSPVTYDTTGMAAGLFAVPKPGARLWVFFIEGDPLFPVYFATHHSSEEWASANLASSPALHYPDPELPSRNAMRLRNAGGGIEIIDTNELEAADTLVSETNGKKDFRRVTIYSSSGSYVDLHSKGLATYSPNEIHEQATGNVFRSCLNKEDFTYGDSNEVCLGDRITTIGNLTQEVLDAIEEHARIVKEINQKQLTQNG